MPTVYQVREHEAIDLPLDSMVSEGRVDLYDYVVGKDYLNAHLSRDRVTFTAGSYIGLVPLNDRVILNVVPKVPVFQLTRILRLARHIPVALESFHRPYVDEAERFESLLDILAETFTKAVDEISRQGLFQDYRRITEDTSFPRGRILIGPTLQHRARGAKHLVGIARYERQANNPPNRLLKYTIWFLAQRYKVLPRQSGRQRIEGNLNRLYHHFVGVQLDRSRGFLNDDLVRDPSKLPANRSYYAVAIHLALLIIQDRGIVLTTQQGQVVLPSLLINMDVAFEAYVREVLRMQLQSPHPTVRVLDGNKRRPVGALKDLFDWGPPAATPDVVLERTRDSDRSTSVSVVVEVKYKPVRSNIARDDLNQAITYGVSYRSKHVVVVHPRQQGAPAGLRLVGRIGGLMIHAYAMDLSSDLQQEEGALGLVVGDLLTGAAADALVGAG